MISRGTITRLIRPALSTREVVPLSHAIVKKLYGTRPQRMKTGKCGIEVFTKIFVNTNVMTPIMTRGFSNDQKRPSDMFRYRILKSFWIRAGSTKLDSPDHIGQPTPVRLLSIA